MISRKKNVLSIILACALYLIFTWSLVEILPLNPLYVILTSTGLLLIANIILHLENRETQQSDKAIELIQAQTEIERLSYYDELTGLPNRRMLLKKMSQSMQDASDRHLHAALLFIDIDHFKTLNDTYGHEIGDRLIKETATRIKQFLPDEATLARPGGDEFGIVLPELKGEIEAVSEAVLGLAEQIRGALAVPFDFGNDFYHSSASIGVSIYSRGTAKITLSDMLRQADTALFQSKDTGRNVVSLFETHMQEEVNTRLAIEQDLRKALSREELRLFLQPQIDKKGKIVGAECLLRWQHPKHGLMSPALFIPVAENTGLIVAIGKWLLYQACSIITRLDADNQQMRISVNVSPRQFRQQDFVKQIKETLKVTGADPQKLILEITESLLMENVHEVIARMVELQSLGIGFSIDDFGTGYSSLSYLKLLPLRELKIDKSFVDGLPLDLDDGAIVGSILALARNLNLEVVAEGIEKEEQLDYLKASGCQLFQGYLHGKPVFCEELITTLLAR
ncbi:MAG: bifunctional diguanylate cyclase/phosphodiesterase [Methylophilales bacterium]|nr:bifunctional diguanylate cyclase/phosphodiesterase [Methylophilales bacterium]